MADANGLTNVSLVGQGFWVKRLERTLHRYVPGAFHTRVISPRALLSAGGIRDIRKSDVVMRVGYRPGAPTLFGRAFDACWSVIRKMAPQAKAVHYWIGTDVQKTIRDHASGRLRCAALRAAEADFHLADASWLAEEMATLGIAAKVLAIPAPNLRAGSPPPLPPVFRVLTYILDYRYRFYGGEAVCKAAQRLPQVQFDVVGGRGRWAPKALANLHFHGWQTDMEPFYRNCCVLLRILEHDSIGVTVKEALGFARHVLYSYPVPHTELVKFNDHEVLIERLAALERMHRKGLLEPNIAGWHYALREFDEGRDARSLASLLRDIAEGARSKESFTRA